MQIIKLNAVEKIKDHPEKNDAYFEVDGIFYAACAACSEPVAVDWRRTRADLLRDIPGEEEYYCNTECREAMKAWRVKFEGAEEEDAE